MVTPLKPVWDEPVDLAPDESPSAFLKHWRKGNALLKDGSPADALKEYQAALRTKPNQLAVVNNLASALVELGRHKDALTVIEEALPLLHMSPLLYYDKAALLLALRRTTDALSVINSALRQWPDDSSLQNLHAAALDGVLRQLARSGLASWSGGKPRGSEPPIAITPGPPVSDLVHQNRR